MRFGPTLALAAGLTGCFPRIEADGKISTTPTCENAGVNATVGADLDAGTSDAELLESYGVTEAVRAELLLAVGTYYVSGSIEDTLGNSAPFNCMSNEAGSCLVDVYGACPDIAQFWNVNLNTDIQGVNCSRVLSEGAETPETAPDCQFDSSVPNFFFIDATE